MFIAFALVVKGIVMAALAPRFGYMGVAYGALAVETCCAAVPAVFIFQRLTGYRLQWNVPLKAAAISVVAALIPPRLVPAGGLAAACLAPALYAVLAFLCGAVHLSEVRSLLKWKTVEGS
jgi:O-antigen/teichoic acid export membrane protein